MVELSQLWLPILLTTFAVFFLSFLMWMVSPHHRKDWSALPDEDGFMGTLRSMRLPITARCSPSTPTPVTRASSSRAERVPGQITIRFKSNTDTGGAKALQGSKRALGRQT